MPTLRLPSASWWLTPKLKSGKSNALSMPKSRSKKVKKRLKKQCKNAWHSCVSNESVNLLKDSESWESTRTR